MNTQRKLTLVVATGALALGAGHFVQKTAADRMAASAPVIVSEIETVAAGPEDFTLPSPSLSTPARVTEPAVIPPIAEVAKSTPETVPQTDCKAQLELIAQPGAMIGVTLIAPCNPSERIVLRHAGLAVTGQTTASGAYFGSVPAMTAMSEVQVMFGSGDTATATIDMPEASKRHRFGVQWQAADAFQLNAFENGADYDQPGHISAVYTGTPGDGAFLSILGDATTKLPLLAEVYTFGADPKADVVIEAAVTEGTCGREILGETLSAADGAVKTTDLTFAMPDCSAIGDILVLKNPDQDTKLAAAN